MSDIGPWEREQLTRAIRHENERINWQARVEHTPKGPEAGRWFRQVTIEPRWVCRCPECLVCVSFMLCVCPPRPEKTVASAVWGEVIMWNPENGHPMAWILEDGRIVQPNVQLMPPGHWATGRGATGRVI